MSTNLIEALRAADVRDFHRPALDAIYAEYEAFVATGEYPYVDSVVSFISARHGLPFVGQPHERYATDPIGKALGHEVYLASGQRAVQTMRDQEAEYVRQGYTKPITALVPSDGLRIAVATIPEIVRCKRMAGEWGLCPPRRRNGYSLASLVASHEAFEQAKRENQTRMNGPRVVMFRPAP